MSGQCPSLVDHIPIPNPSLISPMILIRARLCYPHENKCKQGNYFNMTERTVHIMNINIRNIQYQLIIINIGLLPFNKFGLSFLILFHCTLETRGKYSLQLRVESQVRGDETVRYFLHQDLGDELGVN